MAGGMTDEPWAAVLRETFWLLVIAALFIAITAR